jgi:hypothetical protein
MRPHSPCRAPNAKSPHLDPKVKSVGAHIHKCRTRAVCSFSYSRGPFDHEPYDTQSPLLAISLRQSVVNIKHEHCCDAMDSTTTDTHTRGSDSDTCSTSIQTERSGGCRPVTAHRTRGCRMGTGSGVAPCGEVYHNVNPFKSRRRPDLERRCGVQRAGPAPASLLVVSPLSRMHPARDLFGRRF